MENEIVKNLAANLQATFHDLEITGVAYDAIFKALNNKINAMINEDFPGLVQLLYSMDVSEDKLRNVLNANSEKPACEMIAHLIIERQLQKLKTRQTLTPSTGIPEDEKW